MPELSADQIPENWNQVVDTYESVFESATAPYAEEAIRIAGLKAGERALDIATGPGVLALAAAKIGAAVSAIDFSPTMVERLIFRCHKYGQDGIDARVMDGQNLDFDDQTFDAVFSNFGVIFFPDLGKAFREMHRVLKPDGRALISSWGEPEKFELQATLGQSIRAGLPSIELPGRKLPISSAEEMRSEFESAGFSDSRVHVVSCVWETPSAEWLWSNLKGVSPAVEWIFSQLTPSQTEKLGATFVGLLNERFSNGPVRLTADALIGVGLK